jgi:hypothetical protein
MLGLLGSIGYDDNPQPLACWYPAGTLDRWALFHVIAVLGAQEGYAAFRK